MNKITYVILITAVLALLVMLLYELGLLLWLAALITGSLLVLLILAIIAFVVFSLIAAVYFLFKKNPETDEYGNYRLEDFEE